VPKWEKAGGSGETNLSSVVSPTPWTRAGRRGVNTYTRLWHPWLRINRVLRVMLHTRWSAEAWSQVRVEFRKALALRSEIRRAGWLN
jgi:hypothetical protein